MSPGFDEEGQLTPEHNSRDSPNTKYQRSIEIGEGNQGRDSGSITDMKARYSMPKLRESNLRITSETAKVKIKKCKQTDWSPPNTSEHDTYRQRFSPRSSYAKPDKVGGKFVSIVHLQTKEEPAVMN